MKKIFILFFILTCFLFTVSSQEELLSAKDLLEKLSNQFQSNIKDMNATIKWTQQNTVQEGNILYKNPQKMRINFTEPADQVICTNGYELWLYIPTLNLVLHQNILEKEKKKTEDGKTEIIENPLLINPVGFDKFLTNYAIEFHETKEKIAYKDNAMVYQFKLIRWRSNKNGFNTIYLTVQDNGIIRKVDGVTAAYRHIIFEIDNVKINSNLSDLTFNYTPPAHSSTVENFITTQEEMN